MGKPYSPPGTTRAIALLSERFPKARKADLKRVVHAYLYGAPNATLLSLLNGANGCSPSDLGATAQASAPTTALQPASTTPPFEGRTALPGSGPSGSSLT